MRHIVQSFATTAAVQLLGLVNAVLLARLLGPDGRGEIALVVLYPLLLHALAGLAVNDAIVYRTATGGAAPQRLVPSVLVLAVALGGAAAAAGLLLVPTLHGNHDAEVVRSAAVYMAMVPAGLVALHLGAVFQGRLEYGAWNAIRLATTVVTVAGVLSLALLGAASVPTVTLAYLLGFAASAALAVLLASRRGWLGPRPERPEIAAVLRFAAPLQVGVLVQVVAERLDQVLISQLLTPTDLGLYVAAMAIATIPAIPAVTLGNVAYPRIASIADRGPVTERYLRLSVALAAVIALLLVLAGDRLVAVLYGPAFAPAVPILGWYAAGAVAMAARAILAQAVKAAGRPGLTLQAEMLGLAVDVVALLVLLPRIGVVGAAVAYAAMQGAATVRLAFAARRVAGLDLVRLVRDTPRELRDQAARLLG
ncbi:MAG: lipopolysaccharide biosynthesis protein [Alphaproteobacteria bacterium]|nr:lipopolysaccharide biosynthesis protein [Alphaproteobacteria bacterium]